MAVIWRRRNVLNWIVSMVVAGGPTPIWHQDISLKKSWWNRTVVYLSLCNFVSKLSSGISCFAKDSNVAQCKRITESVKLCVLQGRELITVIDHLDNAWFSAIATSSLSIGKKTPLQIDVTAAMLSLSVHGIILPNFFLPFLWLHRRIVCNDCNAVYSRLMLFLCRVIECYQYSLWHNINLDLVPVSLNGMFVFGIYIVITVDKFALVRHMAWYRQATNHYLITWTNVDDASWRHIASLGINRLTNCGSVTLCNDISLSKSCLTAPSHYWPEPMLTTKNTSATNHYLFKILFNPRGQWFKYTLKLNLDNKTMFLTDINIQWNWPMVICPHWSSHLPKNQQVVVRSLSSDKWTGNHCRLR